MPASVLLRDVIDSDLPIFFEQQLDPVATQMAAFPAMNREADQVILNTPRARAG